ncbi:ABC transporter permease [Thermomonospora cellulosilytica]|uniref:Putative ABC transport system permease protein n=1 Tax=Thermomonospora cellulosilytica TaxID=1411118 RepID=A0A7W3N400_9ACTN|nr:ABC transporter permease [Thermomonospora cellulosilytica]MBA9007148.1 putative ABC transport system permease protein [Thermomonospora cellulosilytica]
MRPLRRAGARHRDAMAALGVRPPRLRPWDLGRESVTSTLRHPGRSLLTALGTVLGAAAFVSTLGLGSTLEHQVSESFDVRRATEVLVRPGQAGLAADWHSERRLARLRELNGVAAAGRRILLEEQPVRRFAAFTAEQSRIKLMGADPEALRAMRPRITAGRAYGDFHERRAAPVVMLPAPLARQLGVTRIGTAIFIGDRPYTVIGVYDQVARRPEAMLALLVPARTADPLAAGAGQAERDVLVATVPGAAQTISAQAPLALRPEGPGALEAVAPPDPRTLRREIEGDVTRISLMLSVVVMAMGTVSIGNAATAGIAARIPEIGLRRSVGGRPSHIFLQLLGETSLLGGFGGVTGALTGVAVISGVSLWNGWTPVIDLGVAVAASLGGAAAGTVAGLLPAVRAMRIEPVAALQR